MAHRKGGLWSATAVAAIGALVSAMLSFNVNLASTLVSQKWQEEHRTWIIVALAIFTAIAVILGALAILVGRGDDASAQPVSNLQVVNVATGPRRDRALPEGPVRCLPAVVPTSFTGRDDELASLDGWLGEDDPPPMFVHGEAGVGKSGLLSYWADRVVKRAGLDVLGFNLGGFGPRGSRKTVADALATWLPRLYPGGKVPQDPVVRQTRFHTALIMRRSVLIFDNISGEHLEEIRALLPDMPQGCRVIVSSRRLLRGFLAHEGMRTLEVRPFEDVEQSVLLLERMMGARLKQSPQAAQELAGFCAGLPLALRIVASVALQDNSRPLEHVIAQLSKQPGPLPHMSPADDELMNVRVVFSWSYQALPSDEARRAFRLLGVYPAKGSTADVRALASLLQRDLEITDELLGQLVSYRLLERTKDPEAERILAGDVFVADRGLAPLLAARYSRHDLLHSYATELAFTSEHLSETQAALERIGTLYYHYVNDAFDIQNRENPMVDSHALERWRISDPVGKRVVKAGGGPFGWFERERTNFVSLATLVARCEPPPGITTALACSAFYFFEGSHAFDDWDDVELAAESHAASLTTDPLDRARWLRNRGRRQLVVVLDYRDRIGTHGDAHNPTSEAMLRSRRLLEESNALYRSEWDTATTPDRRQRATGGVVTTLRELADLRRLEIDPLHPDPALVAKAIADYEAALTAFGDYIGDMSQASRDNWMASFNLAFAMTYTYLAATDPEAAARAQRLIAESLEYASQPDEHGRSRSSRLMAFAYRRLGDLHATQHAQTQAADAYLKSATIFNDELGDPIASGRSLALHARMLATLPARLRDALKAFAQAEHLLRAHMSITEADVVAAWAEGAGLPGADSVTGQRGHA